MKDDLKLIIEELENQANECKKTAQGVIAPYDVIFDTVSVVLINMAMNLKKKKGKSISHRQI